VNASDLTQEEASIEEPDAYRFIDQKLRTKNLIGEN
jgi:hypothetical protein